MNAQTETGNAKAVFVATARRITAPPTLKTLPEHAISLAPESPETEAASLPLPAHIFRFTDRHIHSLGYGIDE